MTQHNDSDFIEHIPCPHCGSSDAAATYTDGHCHCFKCQKTWTPAEVAKAAASKIAKPKATDEDLQRLIESGHVRAIPKRGLTQSTCQKWNYRTALNMGGEGLHIAVYCSARGQPLAAKVRNVGKSGTEKKFSLVGDTKSIGLFGRHLWGSGGKMLVITEGEIDALSVSQAFGNKYPVVSVPNGAQAAPKHIANELEWINTFEKVVLMFDMDDPGRAAAEECARLLPPGKAYIAHLSDKDPNALLIAGKSEEITRAAWNAQPYRPDGIVCAADLIGQVLTPPVSGLPWPWESLTKWTYGRRHGEVYTIGAGTGVGKSDWINQVIAFTISKCKEPCAIFGYESGPVQTVKAVTGKLMGRRFHIPDPHGALWTREELVEGTRRLVHDCAPLFINDHYGAIDWESVKERCRFLAKAHGVKHFVIDPISALVMAADDERRELDRIILETASLAQELDACMYPVSHLTRPEGAPHEEGGRVMLKHFRGSNGIVMFSNYVFGLERDQQSADTEEQSETLARCLKDRYTGDSTGRTQKLHYNRISGALEEFALGDPTNDGTE